MFELRTSGTETRHFFFFFGKALVVFEAYCFWFRAGLSYSVADV